MDALVKVTDGGIELDADGAIERLSGTVLSPPAKMTRGWPGSRARRDSASD